jgi:transposase InsO family protein
MNPWRAGCAETCKSGSEGGPRKRTGRNPDTAPRPDPYTHWQLDAGEHAGILNVIDDHSRLFICSHAYPGVKARDVVESFHRAAELHGLPAALLSDNGAVFTATARHGKVALQTELEWREKGDERVATILRVHEETTGLPVTGPWQIAVYNESIGYLRDDIFYGIAQLS